MKKELLAATVAVLIATPALAAGSVTQSRGLYSQPRAEVAYGYTGMERRIAPQAYVASPSYGAFGYAGTAYGAGPAYGYYGSPGSEHELSLSEQHGYSW